MKRSLARRFEIWLASRVADAPEWLWALYPRRVKAWCFLNADL